MKNPKDERISAFVRDYLYLECVLEEEYMTTSTVVKLLNITERQLSYWDSKGLKLVKRQKKDHKWKRYSILDVFGFGVVVMLKRYGINFDTSTTVIDFLRLAIRKSTQLIKRFALGDYIYLSIEHSMPDLIYSNTRIAKYEQSINDVGSSMVIVPIYLILRFALESVEKEDLTVAFIKDKHGNSNKAVFTVEDNRIGIVTIDFENYVLPNNRGS